MAIERLRWLRDRRFSSSPSSAMRCSGRSSISPGALEREPRDGVLSEEHCEKKKQVEDREPEQAARRRVGLAPFRDAPDVDREPDEDRAGSDRGNGISDPAESDKV